jgi:hypothetical protein
MSNKETKRQHFVPQTYLRKFSVVRKANQFQIFAAPKTNIEEIFPSNTEKVCVHKDLYSLPGETEKERMLIEKFYGEAYEAQYDKMFEILTDDTARKISKGDNAFIISSIITMFFRTTRLISEHNELMYRVFESIVELCTQTGKDYFMFNKEKIKLNGRNAEQLLFDHKKESRVPHVITQLDVAQKLIRIRRNDTIQVIKIKLNGPEYITSDNPVTLDNIETGHIAPFDPKNFISLPLNSQYKVVVLPYENPGFISRMQYDDNMSYSEVMTNGYEQLGSSEKFILGTENGLNEFIKQKKRTDQLADITKDQKEQLEKIKKIAGDLGILP